MRRFAILLPNFDSDGNSLESSHDRILTYLYERFGGYTLEFAGVIGVHRLADGTRADDELTRVVVCVENTRAGELACMIPYFAKELRQETLYFENSLGTVEFIKAAGSIKDNRDLIYDAEVTEAKRHVPDDETSQLGCDIAAAFSIGEFSELFDGRNPGHNERARIDEENRQEQQDNAKPPHGVSWCLADKIRSEVLADGATEVDGQLTTEVIRHLKAWGLVPRVYRSRGVNATVIRLR